MIEQMLDGGDIPFECAADSDEFRAIREAAVTASTLTVRTTYHHKPVLWDCFVSHYGPHTVNGQIVIRGAYATIGPPRFVQEE